MIGYITLGTNQFVQAISFYDDLMAMLGEDRLWKTESMAAWGLSTNETTLCITKPFNGALSSAGNGVMVALKVKSKEQVDIVHACALRLGGANEGFPGPRGSGGFYGAYFRDLDGNKLNAYCYESSV